MEIFDSLEQSGFGFGFGPRTLNTDNVMIGGQECWSREAKSCTDDDE